MLTGSELYDFIKPHLGSIEFTASHGTDMERVKNVKAYEELANLLLDDLTGAYRGAERRSKMGEASVVKLTERLKKAICELDIYYIQGIQDEKI